MMARGGAGVAAIRCYAYAGERARARSW
jgi:hypothetical protein